VLVLLTYLEYNTVVALCWFFGSGGKSVFGVTFLTYLEYNTVVRCVVFWLWQEIVLKREQLFNSYEQFLQKNLMGYFTMIR
jgi:hypothetical protein